MTLTVVGIFALVSIVGDVNPLGQMALGAIFLFSIGLFFSESRDWILAFLRTLRGRSRGS
jgi:hypothetical protein